LFLLALPAGKLQRPAPGLLVAALALFGTVGTLFTTWQTYWT
jgi:hypothetical protein